MQLSNAHRQIVRSYIYEYLKAPYVPVRQLTIERTKRWAFGQTMKQIGDADGVSASVVSHSVRTLALKVLQFAKDKEINDV